MKKEEFIQKIEDIEWEDFEVKEAKSEIPKNSWETVSAFSNTAGGWLVFGVSKKGKDYDLIGISNAEKIESDFLTALRSGKFNKLLTVKPKKYKIDSKTILAFYVPPKSAKDKPVYFNSKINTFIRTGSGDQRATCEEIDAMYRNSSYIEKDSELTKFAIKDLDEETIASYRTHLRNAEPNHRLNELDTKKFLEKLKVIEHNKVTIGGLLVFGTETAINTIVPDFRTDYLEIRGTSYSDAPERYSYRLMEQKNLYEYYFIIFEKLIRHIDIPFRLKGAFRDENQPQVIAIREALVNLLMHTDYFSNAKPRIRVFADRIEFFNPGALPKDIKYILKQDFSLPRNPIIAHIFRVIRLSENIGSGFDKMIEGWKYHYKTAPIIESGFDFYKITFPFGKGKTMQGIGSQKSSQKSSQKIIDLILQNQSITTEELAKSIGVTGRAIKKSISKLKKEGKLRRIGPDKGGYWEIIKK